jgi:hypothetical protein
MSRKGDVMDEIVLRAIAKWPDVPSVYNWLSLDRRGNWLVKGERISNAAVVEFISRNYERDAQGRWYFQNGPQRVFVKLAYTPLIYRVEPDESNEPRLRTHTGRSPQGARAAWMDQTGDVLIESELGVGLIVDRDLPCILDRLMLASGEAVDDATLELLGSDSAPADLHLELRLSEGSIKLDRIHSNDVPLRFGFDPDPRPPPGEPEC